MIKIKFVFVAALILSFDILFAQSFSKGIKYNLESGGVVSSQKNTPFFLHTNTFGTIPTQSNTVFLAFNLNKAYDSVYTRNRKLKKFGFGYGLNFHTNINTKRQFILPEAYLKMRYGGLEIYMGRRKEIQGLVDSTLSSGAYVVSGNALPIPKIQISTPNWYGLGKHKRFSLNAGLSHGWFGNQGIIENYFLHQKWLYFRVNDKQKKIQLSGGINHQTQWGGYSAELGKIEGPFAPTINGYLAPYPWYSYQFIILPFLQKFIPPDIKKLPGFDAGLAIGNQLGSVDLSAIINNRWHFYHQKPFDFARSLINFNNLEDGIYGMSWKSKTDIAVFTKFVGEFIYTKSQGLNRFGKNRPSNKGEYDNYFSHGQYQTWTYEQRIIGTPFILVDTEKNSIVNNRLKVFYLATEGKFESYNFVIKASHSINFGTYAVPVYLKANSILIKINRPLFSGFRLNLYLAQDFGELYPNSTGVLFGFSKDFI